MPVDPRVDAALGGTYTLSERVVAVVGGRSSRGIRLVPGSHHDARVRAWFAGDRPPASPDLLVRRFAEGFARVWDRACPTLGDITLVAIADRVLHDVASKHPALADVQVDASGLRGETLDGLREVDRELARRAAIALDNARLHQTAQQAVRARDSVLAVVSHDLRNPLGGVLTAVAVLEDEVPPESRKALSLIERQAQRMLRLIEDLLDLASLEAGRLSVESGRCEVGALVGDALELEAGEADAKGVELRAELEDEGRFGVQCDAGRIQQVLVNLIGNAVKFTPPGGRITVGAGLEGSDAWFSVTDTGPGIPEEELPHVFDRFWKAPGAGTQGTGLGLAIVQEIVRRHGGSVDVASELGEGTTFRFVLPAARRWLEERSGGERAPGRSGGPEDARRGEDVS